MFSGQASAATYTVTNTDDSGAGSLRQAIEDANDNPGSDTISFNIAGGGVHTIAPESGLPEITDAVTIDGTTQPGAACGTLVPGLPASSNTPHTLLIEISGMNLDPTDPFSYGLGLLTLADTADSTTVKGLVMNGYYDDDLVYGQAGLHFSINDTQTLSDITIECNYIGTDATGTAAVPNRMGIYGEGGWSDQITDGLTIANNLISGNTIQGVSIIGYGGVVTAQNNLIGTDASGMQALQNGEVGLDIRGLIELTVQANVVSANGGYGGLAVGVHDGNEGVVNNNYIGISLDGQTDLGNNGTGIYTEGDVVVAENLVLYNDVGIQLGGVIARDNIVAGNRIGIIVSWGTITGNLIGLRDATTPLANQEDGIMVLDSGVAIGDGTEAGRNVIAANGQHGIFLNADLCGLVADVTVQGNYIGTDVNGEVVSGYGNAGSGIAAYDQGCMGNSPTSVYGVLIGGDESGQANIIAGNEQDGVRVYRYTIGDLWGGTPGDVFGISILQNVIFGNSNLGINLAAADDPGDPFVPTVDLGPNPQNDFIITYPAINANDYLNSPIISSAEQKDTNLTIIYDFTANEVVASEDGHSMLPEDLVGYRLDFYANDNGQDGAFPGYSQGKRWIGSFIVDGSETNAQHTFSGISGITDSNNITATTTLLWTTEPGPATIPSCSEDFARIGSSPPYRYENEICG